MIFDQHDNDFHYRSSVAHTTSDPGSIKWEANIMSSISGILTGPSSSLPHDPYYVNITYPRFTLIPENARNGTADLLLEFRVGRSGLGDDWLYKYTPNVGWALIGRYLEGVNSK
jgi:hypothetical protein